MIKNFKLEDKVVEKIMNIRSVYYYYFKEYDVDETMVESAIKHLLEVYGFSVKESFNKLVNYFTVEEASDLVAALLSTIYCDDLSSKKQLIASVEDYFYYDGPTFCFTTTKEGQDNLVAKLNNLNNIDAYTVILMVMEYKSKNIVVDNGYSKLKEVFFIK